MQSHEFNFTDRNRLRAEYGKIDAQMNKANAAHIQKSLFGQKGVASRASNPLSYGSKTAASMMAKNSSMAVMDEQHESYDMACYSNKIPISSNRQQSSSSKNVVQGH